MASSSDASANQATQYKTFTIPWPKGSGSNLTTVPLTFAIGHSLPTRWFLHRPFCYSPWGDADSGPSEYISYNFPFPHPKSKHPVIPWLPRTKEHDEIIIKGLEDAGVVKRTGDVHKIGDKDYVMLEVLVSEKERIKICGGCNLWEAGVPEEKAADFKGWKRCSRCNQTYYCSESCQKDHWKNEFTPHKRVCPMLAKGDLLEVEGIIEAGEERKKRTMEHVRQFWMG